MIDTESIKRDIEKDINISNKPIDNTDTDKPKKSIGQSNINAYNQSLTHEQRIERARKAGKKSAEMYKERKTITEMLQNMLHAPADDVSIRKFKEKTGLQPPEGVTLYELMGLSMINETLENGNTRAFLAVRDTAGDQPTQKTEVKAAVMTEKDLEIMRNLDNRLSK